MAATKVVIAVKPELIEDVLRVVLVLRGLGYDVRPKFTRPHAAVAWVMHELRTRYRLERWEMMLAREVLNGGELGSAGAELGWLEDTVKMQWLGIKTKLGINSAEGLRELAGRLIG